MKIWDGTSSTRTSAQIRKAPDGEDWKKITQELQATQDFVINLALNANEMPNLLKDIKAGQKKLEALQININKITPPDDIKIQIIELHKEVTKLRNVYQHAGEVLQTVNLLQRQLLSLAKRIDTHAEEVKKTRLSFENHITNWQRTNEQRWSDRLEKVENQLGVVSLALGLKKFGEA